MSFFSFFARHPTAQPIVDDRNRTRRTLPRMMRRRNITNRVIPTDPYQDVFSEDEVPTAQIKTKLSNTDFTKSLPTADHIHPRSLDQITSATPLDIPMVEIVDEEQSCCLPGIFSRRCRVCPDATPNLLSKTGGIVTRRHQLKKRHYRGKKYIVKKNLKKTRRKGK